MSCNSSGSLWTALGAVFAGLSVVAGAFGAHGLDTYFAEKYANEPPKTVSGFQVPASWKRLEDFHTAARYQMYHALGLIAIGLLSQSRSTKLLHVAGGSLCLGIVLFSGSLYALTLTGQTAFGAVAPVGGLLLIGGWLALAMAVCPCRSSNVG